MVEKNLKTPARTLSFNGLVGGLRVADRTFLSRLFLGTGKFSSHEVMKAAVRSSKTEVVTMALRRIDFNAPTDGFMEALKELEKESNVLFLPNTSGARDAEEAIRLAKMVRNATGNSWLKLEVTPDPKYLLPDPVETFKAAVELVKGGFTVLPYMNADPILAKRLEEVGCATVMPLGAPIGSNQGIKTIDQIKIIISRSSIPVVVDAGIGAPSHAALAMELGADAVLVNTAIATAENPVLVAEAFGEAAVAGRKGYLAKLSSAKNEASASSPLTGFLHQSSKKT